LLGIYIFFTFSPFVIVPFLLPQLLNITIEYNKTTVSSEVFENMRTT